MDTHFQQNRLPLSSLHAQYLTTYSRNPTSSPPELFLSIPSIDYSSIYCYSCFLPAPCLCNTVSNNLPASYLDFSLNNTNSPVNSTFNDFDISAYVNTPNQSAHSTLSMIFSASTPASLVSKDTPSGENDEWSHVMRDQRKISGVMSVKEAREKRQQQNRNSQRNFRRRQAKLVEDLKSEVERLRSKNRRLINEVLGLGNGRKGDDAGGVWKKKDKDVVIVRETSEEECRDNREDGYRDEE